MIAGPKTMHPILEAYYAADECRLPSEEADYGVHRRLDGWEYRRRTSYVRTTGEVCAVNQGSTIGLAFILGVVPPDLVDDGDRRSLFYATLELTWAAWRDQSLRSLTSTGGWRSTIRSGIGRRTPRRTPR